MTRKAHIQIDIDAKLADEFAAAVTSAQTSEAEVLREMVEDYVERQKVDSGYRQFLEAKVARGRKDVAAGEVVAPDDAEQMFAERREIVA
uniref:Antitoxin of toxin-antitoxin stability system n=1 Tax=Agrobacterium albertimagni TaxID=147266 RepID=A0A7C1P3P5_9HYPH